MKAAVDQEACIGCGLCVNICPAVFEMNADEKAEANGDFVPGDSEAECREAADQCPVDAISIQ